MKIYDYSNIDKFFVVGDIHGEFKQFFSHIKRIGLVYDENKFKDEIHPLIQEEQEQEKNEIENNPLYNDPLTRPLFVTKHKVKNKLYHDSIICVCGDCGFGFNKSKYYSDILEKVNELFSMTNTHVIFVRGNHDDPSYFDGETINMSNIKAIPDYSVIISKHLSTLCVGGAISVDRTWRKQQEVRLNKFSQSKSKRLFWENEAPFFNENIIEELNSNNIKIDSVVTHTSPSFAYPKEKDTSLGWLKLDPTLKEDIDNERNVMTLLYEQLKTNFDIKFWTYGHFHHMFDELINGTAFIANEEFPSNFREPIMVFHRLKSIEEMEKKKTTSRKRKNRNTQPHEYVTIDDLLTEYEQLMPNNNGEGVIINDENYDEIRNELNQIMENNVGVEIDAAPF